MITTESDNKLGDEMIVRVGLEKGSGKVGVSLPRCSYIYIYGRNDWMEEEEEKKDRMCWIC